MMSIEQVSQPLTPEKLITRLQKWSRERPLNLCILFGSQATGRTHPHSDVDIAVWPTQTLSTADRLRWLYELETLLDTDANLVLVSPDLDPVLGFEIVRDGRLIYEAEPGLWPTKRAQLWHVYNDSLPFRRAARERLRQFAEEIRRGT